ncbi:hypothetical protein EDB89DRAFT_1995203 [Lactarius sanguifluus]|nr:hypothetical protein EDB89DRAFT_1995203 [Lactarius sanguifluus]
MCVCPSFSSSLLSSATLTPTLQLQCLSRTPQSLPTVNISWTFLLGELFFSAVFYLVFANHQPPLPIIFNFGHSPPCSPHLFSSLLSLAILYHLIFFYTPLVHFICCLSYHSKRGVQ